MYLCIPYVPEHELFFLKFKALLGQAIFHQHLLALIYALPAPPPTQLPAKSLWKTEDGSSVRVPATHTENLNEAPGVWVLALDWPSTCQCSKSVDGQSLYMEISLSGSVPLPFSATLSKTINNSFKKD